MSGTESDRFTFSGKGATLRALEGKLNAAVVLPSVVFTHAQWTSDEDSCLTELLAQSWGSDPLIVRSCARNEDSAAGSQAGRYQSVLNVSVDAGLKDAVDKVFGSYGRRSGTDQVLIQPLMTDSVASGVAAMRDISTGAPYIVLNWSEGADTEAVTAGRASSVRSRVESRTFRHLAMAVAQPENVLELQLAANVRLLFKELSEICGTDWIEVEFAVAADGTMVLFQMRPLARRWRIVSDRRHAAALDTASRELDAARERENGVLGHRTVFGVMPDWNPAEMIGTNPKPLSLSLYRTLLTDHTWAESRFAYGYRDLRGVHLLKEFHGLPYIDVRASLNSLIPGDLPAATAERLVDCQLDLLERAPELHDKIEFDVAGSCWTPSLGDYLDKLASMGMKHFELESYRDSLVRLTNAVVQSGGPFEHDRIAIERLNPDALLSQEQHASPADRVRRLLEACRSRGTMPFAGLARSAFIGVHLLNGLVSEDLVSAAFRDVLLRQVGSVGAQITADYESLDRTAFLRVYGHLRPGTYDITSQRYDEAPDQYFTWNGRTRTTDDPGRFETCDLGDTERIDRVLNDAGIRLTGDELTAFIEASVRLRELAKFKFTKVLSEILVEIGHLGKRYGLSREEMAYVPIETVLSDADDRESGRRMHLAAQEGYQRHLASSSLKAPPLLWSGEGLLDFELPEHQPNFVGRGRVEAPVARIDEGDDPSGCIAVVSSADPGYDWIFSRGIVGLVTEYGGANSHMAIRAVEQDVPSMIGCGKSRFEHCLTSSGLLVDVDNRIIRRIA
jgi:glutamine kinase